MADKQESVFWLKNRKIYMIGKTSYKHLYENRLEKFDLGVHRTANHMEDLKPYHIRIINPKDWRKRKKLGLKRDTVLVLFNTPDTKGKAYFFNKIFMDNFAQERTEHLESLQQEPSELAISLGMT
jgi:hypothetical protein